jgi:hypothetical protein
MLVLHVFLCPVGPFQPHLGSHIQRFPNERWNQRLGRFIVKDGFSLLIPNDILLEPSPSMCWDYKCTPPHTV